LLKETTGGFDGAPHYESDVQPTAPRRPYVAVCTKLTVYSGSLH